jgi:heat-inducible transcriptional repressor
MSRAKASTGAPETLSERDRAILREVIHTFVLTGEPVGSRTVARVSQLGVSSATIRSAMARLEELGYLAQPHTSAGRVPTHAAYHLYITLLMQARAVSARDRRYIEENLRDTGADPEQLINVAARLLSELSEQIGLAVVPPIGGTVLKAIDFVALSGHQVLCVLVSASGFIEHRVLEVDTAVPRDELVRISNLLTDHFSGLTLRQIRRRLLRMMARAQREMDQLLSTAMQLAQQALGDETGPEVFVEGTATMLHKPELTDIHRVRRLFDTFADEARLLQLLDQLIAGPGVRVIIGEDSDLTSDLDFSLIATTYEARGRTIGRLGIFGPSRMEYRRVIPLVSHLGESLSRALDGVYGAEPMG